MWYYLSLLICGLGKILKKNSFPSPKNSSQPVPFWGVHNIEKIHKNAPSVHGGAISLCVKFGFLPSWTNSAQSNLLIFIDNIYLSCCTLARLCFPPRFFFFWYVALAEIHRFRPHLHRGGVFLPLKRKTIIPPTTFVSGEGCQLLLVQHVCTFFFCLVFGGVCLATRI